MSSISRIQVAVRLLRAFAECSSLVAELPVYFTDIRSDLTARGFPGDIIAELYDFNALADVVQQSCVGEPLVRRYKTLNVGAMTAMMSPSVDELLRLQPNEVKAAEKVNEAPDRKTELAAMLARAVSQAQAADEAINQVTLVQPEMSVVDDVRVVKESAEKPVEKPTEKPNESDTDTSTKKPKKPVKKSEKPTKLDESDSDVAPQKAKKAEKPAEESDSDALTKKAKKETKAEKKAGADSDAPSTTKKVSKVKISTESDTETASDASRTRSVDTDAAIAALVKLLKAQRIPVGKLEIENYVSAAGADKCLLVKGEITKQYRERLKQFEFDGDEPVKFGTYNPSLQGWLFPKRRVLKLSERLA